MFYFIFTFAIFTFAILTFTIFTFTTFIFLCSELYQHDPYLDFDPLEWCGVAAFWRGGITCRRREAQRTAKYLDGQASTKNIEIVTSDSNSEQNTSSRFTPTSFTWDIVIDLAKQ